MGTEVFMFRIENRHFQCIDNTADCIDDASCEKPSESRFGQCVKDLGECQHTQPPHADVDYRRKPLRAGDPAGFQDHAEQGKTPDNGKQGVTKLPTKDSQADRGIGTGDQYKNHHVINLTEDA